MLKYIIIHSAIHRSFLRFFHLQIYAVVTGREVCCVFTFLLTNVKRKDIDSMVKLKHTSLVLISAECVWQLMSDVSRMILSKHNRINAFDYCSKIKKNHNNSVHKCKFSPKT